MIRGRRSIGGGSRTGTVRTRVAIARVRRGTRDRAEFGIRRPYRGDAAEIVIDATRLGQGGSEAIVTARSSRVTTAPSSCGRSVSNIRAGASRRDRPPGRTGTGPGFTSSGLPMTTGKVRRADRSQRGAMAKARRSGPGRVSLVLAAKGTGGPLREATGSVGAVSPVRDVRRIARTAIAGSCVDPHNRRGVLRPRNARMQRVGASGRIHGAKDEDHRS